MINKKYDKVCLICTNSFKHSQPQALVCSKKCRDARDDQLYGRLCNQKILPTGTTGAISEMAICADLMYKGYAVFRATSPSCFADVVAIKGVDVFKIECRTGHKRTSDNKIMFSKIINCKNNNSINLFAVYIPNISKVHYFDSNGVELVLNSKIDLIKQLEK